MESTQYMLLENVYNFSDVYYLHFIWSQSTGKVGGRGVDSTLFEDKMTLPVHISCYFVGVFYNLLPLYT